MLNLHQTGKFV